MASKEYYQQMINDYVKQIDMYYDKCSDNRYEIEELEKKYDKLSDDKDMASKIERKLEKMDSSTSTLVRELGVISNVTFVEHYVDSINTIKTSEKRKNAYENIEYSIRQMKTKMENVIDEIEDLEKEISIYEDKIYDCKIQIKRLERLKQECVK